MFLLGETMANTPHPFRGTAQAGPGKAPAGPPFPQVCDRATNCTWRPAPGTQLPQTQGIGQLRLSTKHSANFTSLEAPIENLGQEVSLVALKNYPFTPTPQKIPYVGFLPPTTTLVASPPKTHGPAAPSSRVVTLGWAS
jgi:hypothetical protein